jgi:curli biogenesis system outer membrane secretion channel CsgG
MGYRDDRVLFMATEPSGMATRSFLSVAGAGLGALALLTACNQTTMGGGSTVATGSAGASGAQGTSKSLERCSQPIGTAALVESDDRTYLQYDLPKPQPMLRLMMQQSGCFTVVDRGVASEALKRERELAGEGELQEGSNMGGGQMVAADFLITPRVIFQDANSGGGGGFVGSLLPGVAGAVAGGISVQNMEAQTLLTLTNVRTGVQEAAAEGSASKSDIGVGGIGFIAPVAGGAGAYEDTDIGKIVTAAFMDSHNQLVQQLRATRPAAERAPNSDWRTVSRLNVRAGPDTGAPVIVTLREGARVTPTGEKQGGWWQVEANGRQGWVSSDYLAQ